MKPTSVTCGLEYKIPHPEPGVFGNFTATFSITATLQEGETPSEAYNKLKQIVSVELDKQAQELVTKFMRKNK